MSGRGGKLIFLQRVGRIHQNCSLNEVKYYLRKCFITEQVPLTIIVPQEGNGPFMATHRH